MDVDSDEKMMRMWFGLEIDVVGLPPLPYLMRQICVLQWEEIKTKNSGAKHQICVRGDNKIYFYRRHDWIMIKKRKNICNLRVYALKAGERNDNYQDYIQIVKLFIVKLGCCNTSKSKCSFHWNQCKRDSRHN